MRNKETITIDGIKYERCVKNLAWRPVDADIKSLAYSHWQSMIIRTLDENISDITRWYKNVVVCDEWVWFNNFKEWFDLNYYSIEGQRMELDKDLFCEGLGLETKKYSPETCCFLPKDLNNILTNRRNNRSISHDGTVLPCNVHEVKNKNVYKYNVAVRLGKDRNGYEIRKYSPVVDTIEEAWMDAYILKREAVFDRAEKYKEYLPKEVYQALLQYEPKKY